MLRVLQAFRTPAILCRTAETGTRKLLSTKHVDSFQGAGSASVCVSKLPGLCLIGTRHGLAEIGRQVRDIIKAEKPKCVAVELCTERLKQVQHRLKIERLSPAVLDAAPPKVQEAVNAISQSVALEDDFTSAVQAASELNVPVVACDASNKKFKDSIMGLHHYFKSKLIDAGLGPGKQIKAFLDMHSKELSLKLRPLGLSASEKPEFVYLSRLLADNCWQARWELKEPSEITQWVRAAPLLEATWTMHTRLRASDSEATSFFGSSLEFDTAMRIQGAGAFFLSTEADQVLDPELAMLFNQSQKLITPEWQRIVVEDRDKTMVQNVTSLVRRYKSVVAVVGQGHMDGIVAEWNRALRGKAQKQRRRRS